MLTGSVCACCGREGKYARHGFYYKYHYERRIRILRVRCRSCGMTHAVMPSFSLPGTSIGTEEAERYLVARSRGVSRGNAGKELLACGVKEGYPKALERMLEVAIRRGKALFTETADTRLSRLAWIEALCGTSGRPLFSFNRYALDHGVNALCFCRSSILLYGRNSVGGQASHKHGSAAGFRPLIDSW